MPKTSHLACTRSGLRKGDKAAILAANSPEWTLADAGCQFAGIIDVPIYTTLAPSSVRYILNDSGAKVFFIEDRRPHTSASPTSLDDCASLEKLDLFRRQPAEFREAISLAELEADWGRTAMREQPRLLVELSQNASMPVDIATLIYTSGTTGEPKGVMLTHANIISNVIDAGEKYDFLDARHRRLSVLPLSHVFERSAMYLYILNGMAVHYAESVEKVPDNLSEVRPTIFVGVPRIFEKVYAKAKLKARAGGRVERKDL